MAVLPLTSVFDQIVALLLLAAVLGIVALRLHQPLIISFIAVGVLAGPSGLDLIPATGPIEVLAELGLALLLFVVGLKLDIGLIRSVGPVAIIAGLVQVAFTALIGYALALGLGLSHVPALYVAMALSFSSTIIVVKLLSDKRETDSLHGRIAVGLLIVQDILVVLAMIALTGFVGNGQRSIGYEILLFIVKGLVLFAALGILMYLVLPRLLNALARSGELLVLFSIAWAVALASVSEAAGFSKEVGAFLAGVSLASTLYREAIGSRLVSLRDFLLFFFFVDLGTRLDFGLLGAQVWAAIPLSLFVLMGKPLIVMVVMGLMGYRKHTSALTGLTLAQISEFSLILIAMGFSLGQVGREAVGLVTLVGLITIGVSSYMILYSAQLYEWLSPYLRIFERPVRHMEEISDTAGTRVRPVEIILFGLGRYGSSVGGQLIDRHRSVLGVDFDPQRIKHWSETGQPAMFGDAEDPEFPATLPLSEARWVISTIRERPIDMALIHALQTHGFRGSIAVTANSPGEEHTLKDAGADIVFVPFADAASQAADILEEADQRETRRKMDQYIAKLSEHFIVCGYGRMGQQIVKDFREHNVEHVVVERNPVQLPRLIENNVPYVEGKASDDRCLIAAGVERAKGLIAVAASDEENVFIVLTARGINPTLFIVARSILEENEDKLKRAGADKVMSPYVLGGHRMAAAALKPRVMDFLDVATHSDGITAEIGDFVLSSSAPFVNKTIREAEIRKKTGVLVLAVKHTGGEMLSNPDPDTVLKVGDEIIVMGTQAQLDAAEKLFMGG